MKERINNGASMKSGTKSWTAGLVLTGTLAGLTALAGAQEMDVASGGHGVTGALLSEPGPTFVVPEQEIPKQWTVIAYGDTRFTDPANVTATNPKVRQWLVEKIANEHPDALLISGDIPYRGPVAADYDVFRNETLAWRTAKLRVYPAIGNHEVDHGIDQGLTNWWAAFPELNHRRWYSVEFGNAYFIALDSDLPLTPGSMQQQWLAEQLSKLPKKTKFVMLELHHPPMSDGTPPQTHFARPNEIALGEFLEAQAVKMKARIVVVGGHTHNYERFEHGNVVYLVSGGGGAKPYPVVRDADDLYKNAPEVNYHYIKFVFDGKSLNATMYRVDGDVATPAFEARDSFRVPAAP